MTRPKVAPDQRQRTAQACESCKRRKQKCNGLCPCNTCEKRKFECIYTDRGDAPSPYSETAPKKRRVTDPSINGGGTQIPAAGAETSSSRTFSPELSRHTQSDSLPNFGPSLLTSGSGGRPQVLNEHGTQQSTDEEKAARSLQYFSTPRAEEQPRSTLMSHSASQTGPDEEAVVYSQTRMLQDPTGRLLYVGDSATLSFLQIVRMMVESVAGPSPFTTDPRRHKIMENQYSLPSNTRVTQLLPDQRTALMLVEFFFINTHGLIQVFDRQSFLKTVETIYADPLSAQPNVLCLLNLTLAIGLITATPRAGTGEAVAIEKLWNEHLDRAELFYLNAKSLSDPMTGFEDADFWSVQALLLMTIFMLCKSKRNTAFALLGMAVRSAYALGLHRDETMIIFGPEDQAARRNLWRSLFVMDRFLACSLGRPPAISEEDCSGDSLKPGEPSIPDEFGFSNPFTPSTDSGQTAAQGLDAAVRSCSVIGAILKRVYQHRKISTKLAQEIADVCKLWPKALTPSLHWRQYATASPSQGMAILHVNLFYCHSIVLLTRPFFLYILNSEVQRGPSEGFNRPRSRRNYGRMEKFSEACVIASTHTVVLVQNAYEAGYLPRRDPTVIYFLFAAACVILSNEFLVLYANTTADVCMRNAIATMAYCGETDPQASRLLYILTIFRDVIVQQRERRARQMQQANQLPPVKPHVNPYLPSFTSSNTNSMDQIVPQLPSLQQTYVPSPIQVPASFNFGSMQQQQTPPDTAMSPNIIDRALQSPSNHLGKYPRTSQPIEPALTPSAPPNPLSPNAPGTPINSSLDRHLNLSNLLDLSALGPDRVSVSDGSEGQDEHIDFDALWAWPTNTPAVGTPRLSGSGTAGVGESMVQGISDSSVPLFGVLNEA